MRPYASSVWGLKLLRTLPEAGRGGREEGEERAGRRQLGGESWEKRAGRRELGGESWEERAGESWEKRAGRRELARDLHTSAYVSIHIRQHP